MSDETLQLAVKDATIARLKADVQMLTDSRDDYLVQATELSKAIARGGWDISPCRVCGLPVVCLPDGLPSCEACAKEGE